VTTPTMKTSTGNSMARIAFWFWLVAQLWLGVMSVKNLLLCLVSFLVSVVMDNSADYGPPLVLVSSGQGRWRSAYFEIVIQGCQLFWFPLFGGTTGSPRTDVYFVMI
jgi:hypothetical protein